MVSQLLSSRRSSLKKYLTPEELLQQALGLPEEVLQHILCMLPLRALLQAGLVCRLWHRLASWPPLWSRLRLAVRPGSLASMPEVLALPRLLNLHRLRVRAVDASLLQAILLHTGLKELDMRCTDLSILPADLLARVVGRMESVVMFDTRITKEQGEAVLRSAGHPDSQLKVLNIGDNSLEGVSGEALVGLGRLERLEIAEGRMDTVQARALMEGITGDSNLRHLNLANTLLTGVPAILLAGVVAALDRLVVRRCGLAREQLDALLEATHIMEELDIGGNKAARDLQGEAVDRARARVRRLTLSTPGLPIVGS